MIEPLLEQYRTMKSRERIEFLQSRITEGTKTNIPEAFLIEAIAEERDPTAQWFLIKGIGNLKSPDGIESLLAISRAPEVEMGNTSLHSICAWSLGQIGPAAYSSVLALLSDLDPETRRTAVDALGEIGDVRAIPALCAALERDEHKVRIWAGLSLAKMGPSALPCLNRIKSDDDEVGRIIAADAIGKIGQRRVAVD
jgi:hypothetical protein